MNSANDFLVIAAPSGAGKGTLIKYLLQEFPWLALSVSATTRQEIRPGEIDGEHYHFVSPEEFQKKINNNEFIEWEEFYGGKRYGTLKSEVQRIQNQNKVPLFELEVKGALRLKDIYGKQAHLVFIKVPSLEVLEKRLRDRGTEDETKIKYRMERATYEIRQEDKFDYSIMNDDLDRAKKDIKKLILEIFAERFSK